MLIYAAVAVLLGAGVFFRFAPSDPARWHTALEPVALTPCTQVTTTASGARVSCLHPADPVALLARLDGIALATPRTIRLAGSAETGRITWVTRSLFWGFPDYTTAQATPQATAEGTAEPGGSRLDIFARLRFGGADFGVNAARLTDWMTRL